MNAGIVYKTLRDSVWLMLLAVVAIIAFETLLARMLVEIGRDFRMVQPWLELPLVRTMSRLVLGDDLVGDLSPTTFATICMAHPFLYGVTWALIITIGSGVIAGEMGRGTADLLLTLPVSRAAAYLSVSTVLIPATVLPTIATQVGMHVGALAFPSQPPVELRRFLPVAVNFLALAICLSGLTMLVSTVFARRSRAVGILLAVLLISDLLTVIMQFWPAARSFGFISLLAYYRPLPIVRSGHLPPGNMAVLLVLGAAAWTAGLVYFSRRDIPAV